jgi:hypothetical protein
MKLAPFLLIAAAVALVPAQSVAVAPPSYVVSGGTITQTQTNLSLPAYAEISYSNFLAFDPSLGTLNSVTFYLNYVSASGSTNFTQGNSGTNSVIRGFTGNVTLQAGYSGNGTYNGLSSEMVTTDHSLLVDLSLPQTVQKNGSATFNLNGGQYLVASPVSYNVTSGDFTGTGNAPTFTLVANYSTDMTTTGRFATMSYTDVSTLANISLVYDYTAVPESSTYGIGLGVLALAAVAVRRRKVKA